MPHVLGMAYAKHPRRFLFRAALVFGLAGMGELLWFRADALATNPFASSVPLAWQAEWPDTDFSRTSVTFGEIQSGGPPKDGIPAIDKPEFVPIAAVTSLPDTEPVLSVEIGGETKVYPLRILIWHEIVNDTLGGVPIAVTYCPLCNAGIVFEARIDGQTLDFGTTGKLRNSDLVMYDRQSQSWWQQFSGKAIIGARLGQVLNMLPSRLEAFALVKQRAPNAQVLSAKSTLSRPYGSNPYVGYDTSVRPFLFAGDLPPDIQLMMRVAVVDGIAWTLPYLKQRRRVEYGDLVLSWTAGQNSALDTRAIKDGRDVGNVLVQRKTQAVLVDEVHHVTFAFVFYAFHPDGLFFKNERH